LDQALSISIDGRDGLERPPGFHRRFILRGNISREWQGHPRDPNFNRVDQWNAGFQSGLSSNYCGSTGQEGNKKTNTKIPCSEAVSCVPNTDNPV
jgi:hypothetical protein